MAIVESYRVTGVNEDGSEQRNTYYKCRVADYLLADDPSAELRKYDLSGFPVPITDPEVARQLDGLDPRSYRIAQNLTHCVRLNAFIDSFVAPDELVYEPSEGVRSTYDVAEASLAGDDGSLIHLRHVSEQSRHERPAAPLLAVISHLDSTQPALQLPAQRQDILSADGARVPTYTIGDVNEANLQLVDRPMSEHEWELEKAVRRSEGAGSLSYIELSKERMSYRRTDNHWEMLGDMGNLHRRVGMALSRRLGYAAGLASERQEVEAGQFDQKVVV